MTAGCAAGCTHSMYHSTHHTILRVLVCRMRSPVITRYTGLNLNPAALLLLPAVGRSSAARQVTANCLLRLLLLLGCCDAPAAAADCWGATNPRLLTLLLLQLLNAARLLDVLKGRHLQALCASASSRDVGSRVSMCCGRAERRNAHNTCSSSSTHLGPPAAAKRVERAVLQHCMLRNQHVADCGSEQWVGMIERQVDGDLLLLFVWAIAFAGLG